MFASSAELRHNDSRRKDAPKPVSRKGLRGQAFLHSLRGQEGLVGVKVLAILSGSSAILGASTVVDSSTLVPMGLLVAAILLTAKLAWNVANLYGSFKRRLHRLEVAVKKLADQSSPPVDFKHEEKRDGTA